MSSHPLSPNLSPEDLAGLNDDVANCESRVRTTRMEVNSLQTRLDAARQLFAHIPDNQGEDKTRAQAACDVLHLDMLGAYNRQSDAIRDLQHAKELAAGLGRYKARRSER